MAFTVREMPRAKIDKRSIFVWLFERSKPGAGAWLNAYDSAIERLKQTPEGFGEALENDECLVNVKQAFFKTRHGRTYRILFMIDGSVVYVLRVRGPGQAPVSPDEL